MAREHEVFMFLQGIFCTLAIPCNLLLLFVIATTSSQLGAYKWFMFSYSFFEILYAVCVLVYFPIIYVGEKTEFCFSFKGPFLGTRAAFLGTALYCFFYEVWMVFVAANFTYRYICVCHTEFAEKVKRSRKLQAGFWGLGAFVIFVFATCNLWFCVANNVTKSMEDVLRQEFGLEDPRAIGYVMLRLTDDVGNISYPGLGAVVVHILLVSIVGFFVIYFNCKIWQKIKEWRTMRGVSCDVSVEKQLYNTLVIQTLAPLFLYLVPSVATLCFIFWGEINLGPTLSIFGVGTMAYKFIDPLVALICIVEFRIRVKEIFRLPSERSMETTSEAACSRTN